MADLWLQRAFCGFHMYAIKSSCPILIITLQPSDHLDSFQDFNSFNGLTSNRKDFGLSNVSFKLRFRATYRISSNFSAFLFFGS